MNTVLVIHKYTPEKWPSKKEALKQICNSICNVLLKKDKKETKKMREKDGEAKNERAVGGRRQKVKGGTETKQLFLFDSCR